MKLFAILSTLSCILLATAEPPVPNTYLPPNQRQNSPANNYLPPSTNYGVPSTSLQGPTTYQPRPSTNYGAPSASQPQRPNTQYGAPSQQYSPSAPSQQYGAPAFDAPSAPGNSYQAPQPTYSAPQATYSAPQQPTYSAPQQPQTSYGPPSSGYADTQGYTNGGYENSGEPAKYSFQYDVNDIASGNDFGHMESRDGDKTVGRYYVLLPDGRKQIVTYEADKNGYRPTITYEEANQGGQNGGQNGYPSSNGYNNNGQFNGY